MAWIQVHQQLKDHRKLLTAADELGIEPPHMLGLLISFWLWALDNAPTGSLNGIGNRMMARAAQWSGDPDTFVEALTTAGLLKSTPDGLEIHDWYEYTGKLLDRRESEKNRARRRRAAAAASSAGQPQDVRSTSAGRPPDGTQDDRQTSCGRVEQSRVDQSRADKSKEDTSSSAPNGAPAPAAEPTPYKEIVALYHEICKSYPKLRIVSEKRKRDMAARWKEYKRNLETFRELFTRAEASPFLKGKNERSWAADFNWLMNSENMAKVLEGKYNDEQKGGQSHGEHRGNYERHESAGSETALSGFRMADG